MLAPKNSSLRRSSRHQLQARAAALALLIHEATVAANVAKAAIGAKSLVTRVAAATVAVATVMEIRTMQTIAAAAAAATTTTKMELK